MKVSTLITLCIIISIVVSEGEDEGYEKYIESRDYNVYLKKSQNNAAQGCAVNELAAYGLMADITSTSEPNPICPQMTGNCCGKHAQELINTYWEADDRHQSFYYNSYLKMNKYILGNGKNYQNIVSDVIDKSKMMKKQNKNQPTNSGGTPNNSNQGYRNDGKPYTYEYHKKFSEAAEELNEDDFFNRAKVE